MFLPEMLPWRCRASEVTEGWGWQRAGNDWRISPRWPGPRPITMLEKIIRHLQTRHGSRTSSGPATGIQASCRPDLRESASAVLDSVFFSLWLSVYHQKFPNSTVARVWTARPSRHICLAYPRDVHCELLSPGRLCPARPTFDALGTVTRLSVAGIPISCVGM